MKHAITFLTLIVLLIVTVTLAVAQSGGGYELTWSTMDGGGGTSSNGGYTLDGTIGQLDAGAVMTGGGYALVGGFWGGALTQYRVYLPLVLKGS